MKSFFKTIFATFFALVLFSLCLGLLFVGLMVGLARLGSKQEPKIQKGSCLVFNMSVNLTDTPPPSSGQRAFDKLFGGDGPDPVSVRQAVDSISAAAKDDRITGILLHGSFAPQGYGSGFAAIKEVRESLLAFKAAGKSVTAYLVSPDTRDYYLASVANTVYLNPFGEMDMAGLSSQPMFFHDALEKYGIGVQVSRVGKYKSAVEAFTRNSLSPEAREESQKLLDDLWGQFKLDVAAARKELPAEQIQTLADANGVITAESAKANHLVDQLAYLPDVIEELKKTNAESNAGLNTFRQVSLSTYAKEKVGKSKDKDALSNLLDSSPKLAIVYAEGEIVGGEGENNGRVNGDRFARELRKLRQDSSVKAVVLRVNSPGGGVTASEIIQRELVLMRDAGKPVVVSMGTVAASGGYWISTASERIFAEPNTITGSIGVFGLLPNIQKLANDHGVTFDEVKTGKFAGLGTIARPKTDEEMKIIQSIIDNIYNQFKSRVAASRKLTVEQVEEIAQGRVWSGLKAKELNLVDEIGGLQNAIAYAKDKAKLPVDAKIIEYPAPKEFAEVLAEIFGEDKKPLASVGAVGSMRQKPEGILGEFNRLQTQLESLRLMNDPRGVYARLPFDLQVK
jgi:protease-4